MQIHEGAELHRLAAQICLQAVRDLIYEKNPVKKLDAFLFVTSPDFQVWSDAGSLEFPNPYKLLSNLRETKELLRTRRI
jgi:hypothetical protein